MDNNDNNQPPQSPAPAVMPEMPAIDPAAPATPATIATPTPMPTPPTTQMLANDVMTAGHQSAGTLILQWLTYAFWGWAVLSMSLLSTGIVLYFINKSDTATFDEYALAAVVILVPIAFACDWFYSKKEPAKKTGGAQLIMVIHAVLFALIAVGALIFTAFTLVTMFTSSSTQNAQNWASIVSSLIIFVFYLLTFLRTLNPQKLRFIRKIFLITMPAIMLIMLVLAIVGPLMHVNSAKDDSLIDSSIPTISSDIDTYVSDNSGLMPNNYQDLQLTGDELTVFQRGLVTYKYTPELSVQPMLKNSPILYNPDKTYKYELCTNYKFATTGYKHTVNRNAGTSYADVSNHPAGPYCYNLTATYYPSTFSQ